MTVFIFIVLGFLCLSLYRIIFGPSVQDRLLGLNVASSQIIVLMCFIALEYGQSFYLDAAIIYALLSFAEIVAILRYLPFRREGRGDR